MQGQDSIDGVATGDVGLWLHRSPRMEVLADRLLAGLEVEPVDPMRIRNVVVGSRGMARWLRHHIATRWGVCAGMDFPFIEHALLAAVSTIEHMAPQARSLAAPPPLASSSGEGSLQEMVRAGQSFRTVLDGGARYGLAWSVVCAARSRWTDPALAPVRDYLRSLRDSSSGPVLAGNDGIQEVDARVWAWAAAVAACLDRYALYRPAWLVAWTQHHALADEPSLRASGLGGSWTRPPKLPEHLEWQRVLWQEIRRATGRETLAERIQSLLQVQPAYLRVSDPTPLHVFGVSAVGPSWLSALNLLSRVRPVHLYAWVPTHDYIADAAALHRDSISSQNAAMAEALVGPAGLEPPVQREAEETLRGLSSRVALSRGLLSSCARVSRDFQLMLESDQIAIREPDPRLGALDGPPREVQSRFGGDELEGECSGQGSVPSLSLLEAVQRDVYGGDPWMPEDETQGRSPASPAASNQDTSILILDAAGPLRQVEALREALMHRLESSASLMPRHILIMTPDLDAFAPLVDAVFSRPLPHGDSSSLAAHANAVHPNSFSVGRLCGLPVEIADVGLRSKNPAADLVLKVLELTQVRLTVPVAVDLMANELVRRRFGFSEEDLAVASAWLASAGIRWGWNGSDRVSALAQQEGREDEIDGLLADRDAGGSERWQPAVDEAHTWHAGLVALARGATLSGAQDALEHGVAAAGFARESEHALLGALLEFCRQLHETVETLRRPASLELWRERTISLLQIFARAPEDAPQIIAQVLARCDDFLVQARDAARWFEGGEALPIDAGAMLLALRDELEGSRESARTSAGGITMCALAPMRSVPFRVVCLLGLDEASFPRRSPRSSLDATARSPALGDRDSLTEDRQLFLEALFSAREQLVITFSGRDPLTDASLPTPSVIDELCDTVDRIHALGSKAADAEEQSGWSSARQRLIRRTPLSPYSRRSFGNEVSADVRGTQTSSLTKGLSKLAPDARADFDTEYLAIARALAAPRSEREGVLGPFASVVLPPAASGEFTPALDTKETDARGETSPYGTPKLWQPEGDESQPGPQAREPRPEISIMVDELIIRLADPARELLRRRVGLASEDMHQAVPEQLPVTLERREMAGLRELLLRERVENGLAPASELLARLRAAGRLPIARAGDAAFQAALRDVDQCLEEHRDVLAVARLPREIDVSLPGLRLRGRVDQVSGDGHVLSVTTSRVDQPRVLLSTWLRVLAVGATFSDAGAAGTVIGLDPATAGGALRQRTMQWPAPAELPQLRDAVAYVDHSVNRVGAWPKWLESVASRATASPDRGDDAGITARRLIYSLAQLSALAQRRALRWSLRASWAWAVVAHKDSTLSRQTGWLSLRGTATGREALLAARSQWSGTRNGFAEGGTEVHRLIFPEHAPFESVPTPHTFASRPGVFGRVEPRADKAVVRRAGEPAVNEEFVLLTELIWRPLLIALDQARTSERAVAAQPKATVQAKSVKEPRRGAKRSLSADTTESSAAVVRESLSRAPGLAHSPSEEA